MADLSFQNRLQVYGNRLSKSEQRIAAYITAHPAEAAGISSMELAQATGTSNSTLTRFCQKLAYRNYIEFQTLLSAEGAPMQAPEETMQRMCHYYQRTLEAASELVTAADLDLFTAQIHSAKKILIFGLGSSGLTANEFNMRLVQMGFTSTAMTDSFLMMVQTSLFSNRDLIIAVSNSGETREVVSACEIAKSVGAHVCALTQARRAPLARIADTILLAGDIRQTGDENFIDSQLPLLFLINAITYRLLEDPKCRENRKKALQALFNR
ncbi:MurR/RpiR family transcriptional regulator [Butyricicoccus faecihominis]|uniref:MurR/RpiR family transcriptional regulator n=1 Tax=Butyricicoccaceae TaxID=3085642 RepID=UPI002479527E|nr:MULTISPECIES: MurR/RpiR family transcriptional regulator [Butyricicoccaceae]MCQ5131421.1 MurR/RpiR family transcriptional regulator [Butyricicoccus faecihominis]WNX84553.1 MurR/RpiR family transcriptional regulator [Agathobaculum sp. NTUH-O15-33]